jgi:hypothetical protein
MVPRCCALLLLLVGACLGLHERMVCLPLVPLLLLLLLLLLLVLVQVRLQEGPLWWRPFLLHLLPGGGPAGP